MRAALILALATPFTACVDGDDAGSPPLSDGGADGGTADGGAAGSDDGGAVAAEEVCDNDEDGWADCLDEDCTPMDACHG